MMTTALILLGHGSHISPNTAGLVWQQVDSLRQWGVADEISAAFWKEQPSFRQVLATVQAADVTLVPLFTADGYFTKTVIPAEMSLSGAITEQASRTIRYASSLANHPHLGQILQRRARQALADYALPPDQTAIAIIGHGTRRNPSSRTATYQQAEALRSAGLVQDVVVAFLDDDPSIPMIYQLTSQPHLLIIPYFLALGSHTTIDVPQALGLPEGQQQATLQGHEVYYLPPLGLDGGLTQIILDLAFDAGLPFQKQPSQSAWGGMPQVGTQALYEAVITAGQMPFGELWLTPNAVYHQADHAQLERLRLIEMPSELRFLTRHEPFRPLMAQTGLPQGWQVSIPANEPNRLAAVVETVYPGVLAAWAGAYDNTPLEALAARQTGIYFSIGSIPPGERSALVERICGQCILQPTWDENPLSQTALPCAEACNWWMSQALSDEEDT
jgi:sirohydrochlorin cobaltochelatase